MSELDAPEAPPLPPEEGKNLGLPVLACVNVLLALYLLFNSVAPVIWGQVIATVEATTARLHSAEALEDDRFGTQKPAEESKVDARLAKYRQYRWVHVAIALTSVLIAAGLGRSAFLAVFYDYVPVIRTTIVTAITAILLSVNLGQGWGGWLSVIAIVLALLETGLLYVPAVQRYLAEIPASDGDEDEYED